MTEKKVKYEIVKVKKTEDESELEKAISEFNELCKIYNIVLNEDSDTVKETTQKLIKDIKKQSKFLRENLQQDIIALQQRFTNPDRKTEI